MVLLLLIIIIHEFGHLIAACVFKKEMSSIVIYPFGGLTKIDGLLNDSILKEFIILIMGPIMQVLFYLLISYLYSKGYVMSSTYSNFSRINFLLLVFNLLPILPLDGGRFLNLLFNIRLPFKYSHIISVVISIIVVVVLAILMVGYNVKLLYVLILLLILRNLYYEGKMHRVLLISLC